MKSITTEKSFKNSSIPRPNTSKYRLVIKIWEYSSTTLLEKISNSWMFDEEILLLIKENRHREAIQKYVDNGKYAKAEEFCITKDKSLGLLTTLLTIYFQYYEEYNKNYKRLILETRIQEAEPYRKKAQEFSTYALNLMRNHSAKN